MSSKNKKNTDKVSSKSKTWVVVGFVKEKRKGKLLIEVVPNSWLHQEGDDEWTCYFPPKDETNVSSLIEQGNPPQASWKLYKVNIIKTAVNYEQGLRRMERAYVSANIESTSACSDVDNQSEAIANESDAEQAENPPDQQDDVSSTTSSSPKKFKDVSRQNQKPASHMRNRNSEVNDENTPMRTETGNSGVMRRSSSDSEDNTLPVRDVNDTGEARRGKKRKRNSGTVSGRDNLSLGSDDKLLHEFYKRMDETDERIEKIYKKLSKQVKGAKQSVLYDFTKKMEGMKNTIIVNRGPGRGNSLKQHKEALAVKLPIETYDTFIEFDAMVKDNAAKETALKEIMADAAGTVTQPREAVRKILGSLIMKAVQELYSGTGKKGPNGVTKKNFSGTHTYACMKDVIQDMLEVADGAAILSATSRYLSGAGDREGGKAQRDARKAAG